MKCTASLIVIALSQVHADEGMSMYMCGSVSYGPVDIACWCYTCENGESTALHDSSEFG